MGFICSRINFCNIIFNTKYVTAPVANGIIVSSNNVVVVPYPDVLAHIIDTQIIIENNIAVTNDIFCAE